MDRHLFDGVARVSARELEDFSVKRWVPPTIGKGGHLVYAEPREDTPRKTAPAKPLSAADHQDLESTRESAKEHGRQEGFEFGKQEGLALGKTEGYTQGFEQGRQEGLEAAKKETNAELNEKLTCLNLLLTNITHTLNEQDYQLEQALLNLVQEVSRAVIARELQTDSGHIMKFVRTALASLPPSRDNVRIIVNPKDLNLLEQAAEMGGENWRTAASEEVAPGGCRIQTDQSVVDFTTETRFRQAVDQIVNRELSLPLRDDEKLLTTDNEEPFEHAPEPVVKNLQEDTD